MKNTLSFGDSQRSDLTWLKVTKLGASPVTFRVVFSHTYRLTPHFNQEW